MPLKPDIILWRGPHPDNPAIGLRVVQRNFGNLYGEEYLLEEPEGDRHGGDLVSIHIGHVAAHAVRALIKEIEEMKKSNENTKPPQAV